MDTDIVFLALPAVSIGDGERLQNIYESWDELFGHQLSTGRASGTKIEYVHRNNLLKLGPVAAA